MKVSTFFCFVGLVFGLISPSHAAPITTLFNTGVDDVGMPLSDGTIADPHYSLIVVPEGSTSSIRVRTSAGGFPIPPYFGDNSLAAWIGPNNDSMIDGPEGTFMYRTTFDLTGLNPETASINGQWSTDNNGTDIFINGISTGATTAYEQFASGFSPFAINSGFISGVNTLDFVVFNGFGPTSLRVEVSGATSPVPVPAAIWLFGSAVFILIRISRYRPIS
jgi:hypothetical protein